jgi:parallel beta-helix repeat protein
MAEDRSVRVVLVSVVFLAVAVIRGAEEQTDYSPPPTERQLPRAMHSEMKERPQISVGQNGADLIGNDNRVIQAAVDYIANLGGGTVVIGPGEYLMRDSLHLRSGVIVRGGGDKTRLCKASAAVSPLALDGDFGEEQITLQDAAEFRVGDGVAIWDSRASGFHTTVARITGRNQRTLAIDMPLMADCMVSNNAKAATVFPVVSGRDIEGAVVENLVVVGNKESNVPLNGCRGAGIYLFRGHGTMIRRCTVQGYNGDGISFQQSNDVTVEDCVSTDNAELGLHPGSGSQRPIVRRCTARNNGTDGLFLCWRVRHGLFEHNVVESNGRFGISIGHKDSDNLLQQNRVSDNAADGVFFRNESLGMAAHRNRLVNNVIENNGSREKAAGIRIRGETSGLVFENNTIRDTRNAAQQTQQTGILIEAKVGSVELLNNTITATTPVQDERKNPKELRDTR